jgi:hypothetical protein
MSYMFGSKGSGIAARVARVSVSKYGHAIYLF